MKENKTFICIDRIFYIYDLTTFSTGFLTSGSTNVIKYKFEMHNMLSVIERLDTIYLPLVLSILLWDHLPSVFLCFREFEFDLVRLVSNDVVYGSVFNTFLSFEISHFGRFPRAFAVDALGFDLAETHLKRGFEIL
ncbi:hypothetical protein Fmac_025336 [Flemingia macrophylla]|uniref:Uncharacterized protein n=1 Tax=Flemingia macrophylla TaxID=520843 RepID=A0ABD1LRX4_9FABA